MSPFDEVVGQPAVVARLAAAAIQPVHAYLFIGPPGSGKRAAAAAFAAAVLSEGVADADAAERHASLALAWKHPDAVLFEPVGRTLRVEEAEHIVVEASRSPVEGRRKIIVCDRFHTAEPIAAASLLKTVEEPPPSTILVFLSEEVPNEHVTIASRCTIIEFGAVPDEVVSDWLRGRGVDHETADIAALSARGDLRRARLLAADPEVSSRRQLWFDAPARLDGTGAGVAAVVDEIRAAIDRAQEPLDARHREEAADLERRAEQLGVTATTRKEVMTRHRREERRLRDDELRYGFAVLAGRYRSAVEIADAEACIGAVDSLRDITDALVRNPNEELHLQRLFLGLPPLP